ncbi:MAG: DoxX family membrane protein, partial [Betaproteobacteria bacterium]|nr:DoxX family membrane protein [Betaproteobacteria bacterium]
MIVAVLAFIYASPAMAHVRWFVSEQTGANVDAFALSDPVMIVWIFIAIILIGIAIALDGRLPVVPVANTKIRHDVMELMRIFTGISFLLTAYKGALVAPHLIALGGFGTALGFLQALIGILLLSNHFVHIGSYLIGILFLGMLTQFGFLKSFEYVNIIGIALFLLFNHHPSETFRQKLKPYSVDILRIFTGVHLIILGISEKIYGATLGQAFIAKYSWNFMHHFGFDWFSDSLFVLSAGMMEVIFGIILVLGVITRLNTLVIAGVMLLSNIVFLVQGARTEALTEI